MTVSLLAACDDRDLFDFAAWPRQRELLAALHEGPRLHVLALGRRSGKSTMAALVCLYSCLFRADLDAMVRPGETRYAVAVATRQAQARLIVAAARSIVERSPLLAPLLVGSTEDELRFELPSGARTALAAFPCSSRGGRGWPISTLVMDEAAHFIDATEGPAVADKVLSALMPATAQFGDEARIIVSSTPWGDDGMFAELFHKAESGELADARAHRFSTAAMNPTITETFLEQERLRDPDTFDAEYRAQFLGSGSAFIDFDRIAELGDPGDLPAASLHGSVCGIDPAFARDPFGLAVVGHAASDARHLRVGAVRGWQGLGYEATLNEAAAVAKTYAARVVTDQYSADAVVHTLTKQGLGVRVVTMGAASKTAVYSELRARLYNGSLILPEHPELLAELRRLRVKHTAGSSSVISPRVGGSHGDMAQALALATYEHRYGSAGIDGWPESNRNTRRPMTAGLLSAEL